MVDGDSTVWPRITSAERQLSPVLQCAPVTPSVDRDETTVQYFGKSQSAIVIIVMQPVAVMAVGRLLLSDGCGPSYLRIRSLASSWSPACVRSKIVLPLDSGRTEDARVCLVQVAWNSKFCRHMCSSSKPPELSESNSANDKNVHKKSETASSSSVTSTDKPFTLMTEMKPEAYSFRQQLSEKSSSVINSMSKITKGAEAKKPEDWNDILNRWYQQYQDFIGITDLKNAQDRVTELSEVLHEVQGKRRELQAEIEDLQEKLAINHERISKSEQYSQEHFTLFDQARDMNSRLKTVRLEFVQCERHERDTFTQMSAAIRDCHERERMQAEQSKYWSIIASVVSAALASLITSVNNWVRIREIKDHVSGNGQSLLDGFQQMHKDVLGTITTSLASPTHSQPGLVKLQQTAQSNPGICESSDRQAPAITTIDDVAKLTENIKHTLLQHINASFVKEREVLIERLNTEFETIVSHIVSEGGRARDEITSLVKQSLLEAVSSPLESGKQSVFLCDGHHESPAVVETYSYRRIATAMAVGAGIGTLATAFVLKAIGGSGV